MISQLTELFGTKSDYAYRQVHDRILSTLVAEPAIGLESVGAAADLACIAQYSLRLPVVAPTRAAARAIARRLEQS